MSPCHGATFLVCIIKEEYIKSCGIEHAARMISRKKYNNSYSVVKPNIDHVHKLHKNLFVLMNLQYANFFYCLRKVQCKM